MRLKKGKVRYKIPKNATFDRAFLSMGKDKYPLRQINHKDICQLSPDDDFLDGAPIYVAAVLEFDQIEFWPAPHKAYYVDVFIKELRRL